jgi:hypothetical protein
VLYKRKMRSFIVAVCLASLLQLAVGEYVWVNGEWVWKEDAKARIVILFYTYLANVNKSHDFRINLSLKVYS